MNHESVSLIARNTFSELLQRPIGRRVVRDIEMKESSRADFHDDENVDQLECRGHHDKEIASDDGFGVISDERHPSLLWICRTLGQLWHVTPNCSR